jgi:hypothetical protein
VNKEVPIENKNDLGVNAANEILQNERAGQIIYEIRNAK